MTQFILIRHGETDWNVEGRWQGQADVALNNRGRKQAQQLAEDMRSQALDAIYASDLRRASDTATTLARQQGVEVRLDPRLREIHQGEWQGLLVTEIQARYAERFVQRRQNPLEVAPPGGETVAQVRTRVIAAFEEMLANHRRQTVAVVAHGFVLAVALVHYRGLPLEEVWSQIPGNCVPIELEMD